MNKILKIGLLRKVLCFFRYLYFVKFLKRYKFYSAIETKNVNKKDIDALKDISYEDRLNLDRPNNYYENIYIYEKNRVHKKIEKLAEVYRFFSGDRSQLLLNPILSCLSLDKKSCKVLSIGPRTEGEIFNIVKNGFNKNLVSAIDLQTYSPLIKLGDIHEIPFDDNSFDIVLCGWVLRYSYNRKKAISELIRVTKDKGIISIGSTYKDDDQFTNEKIVNFFGDNLSNKLFDLNNSFYPQDSKRKHNILTVSITK